MRNNFYNRFKQFIEEQALFGAEDKVLLTVSGGIDSVVMAHLFHRAGYNFGIAHCNFQLRGNESDADEALVMELAKNLDAPFFVKNFDTKLYAVEFGLSIQMAARDLRYAWFQEILQQNKYNYIATAHHRDDVAETILLNLIKGGVLKGLHGILPKSNNIIRPLLFATKKEIKEHATFKKYQFREDKSNAENKYQRNLIRNKVIPILKQINPDLTETMSFAASRRHQLDVWANTYSEQVKSKIITEVTEGFKVSVPDLKTNNVPPEIFFKWTEKYGFNYVQVEEMYGCFDRTETKIFLADEYRMVKNRDFIAIEKIGDQIIDSTLIEKGKTSAVCGKYIFAIQTIHKSAIDDFTNLSVAYLDKEKLQYPLLIRKWQHGDSFKPYGLRGQKNISDFITDQKLSFQEKENQLVICSGDDICWVVRRRIDERYKVSEKTENVLKISASVFE